MERTRKTGLELLMLRIMRHIERQRGHACFALLPLVGSRFWVLDVICLFWCVGTLLIVRFSGWEHRYLLCVNLGRYGTAHL